jgi:hypothetical protein
MCVYAKPRYFNAKGREELREGIRSVTKKFFSIGLRQPKRSEDARQTEPHGPPRADSISKTASDGNNITTKLSLENNSLIPMETEVVPFGASDAADEPDNVSSDVISQKDEHETIPLGAPNSIDKPGNAPSPSNPPPVDEKRFSMIRTTLMALPRFFIKMDSKDEAETNNETADVGLTLNDDQRDVIAGNEDDEIYEMLIAG